MTPSRQPDDERVRKKWAVLRLALGQAQMMGAVAGVIFLMATGPSALTIWTVLFTGLIAVVSIYLFRIKKKA